MVSVNSKLFKAGNFVSNGINNLLQVTHRELHCLLTMNGKG